MRPEDIVKIARDAGWSNEDIMRAIYNLSKEIVNPSGSAVGTCYICAGDKIHLGAPCPLCGP